MKSKLELMALFSSFDGEVSMSDFTPDELEHLLKSRENAVDAYKRKYFEYYDDIKSQSLKKQDW